MMITLHKHGPQQVTGMNTYSKITKEDLYSVTDMQLSPMVFNSDAAKLMEKKYVTRPRQAKRENVSTQRSGEDGFGDKVIKEAEALSPTTSSTKNGSYMMTVHRPLRRVSSCLL